MLVIAVIYVVLNLRRRRSLHVAQPAGDSVSEAVAGAASAAQRDSILRLNLRRFARDRIALAAALAVALFVAIALLAPWLAPHDPYDTDLLRRLQPPAWMEGGDWRYLLGCDALGRDILSRIIYGARISISIGVVVVAARAASSGTAAGARRGLSRAAPWTPSSRASSTCCSAFPTSSSRSG